MNYNLAYYYNMLRMYSNTAKQINKIRWDFIKEVNPKIVLDYGCGCGFFKAFAPEGVEVDTYDIMPSPQTGIKHAYYDVLVLWDVLEHFNWGNLERNYDIHLEKFFDISDYVAITVPILPEEKDFVTWKHRKPNEHQFYFSVDILKRFFSLRNFKLIKSGNPETILREDIYSALYGKTQKINIKE